MKPTRSIALVAGAALIAAAFATPAAAGKKLKCTPFAPSMEEAAEAEVVKVTPKASEAKPIVIEYEHSPSAPGPVEEILYFNIQTYSATPTTGLYIKQEFDTHSDIDLYLYDEAGEEVASSGAFNPLPIPPPLGSDTGGPGYEEIPGFEATQCAGYTIESAAYLTPGTPVKLSIWYGEIAPSDEG